MQTQSAKEPAWTFPLWAAVVLWLGTYFVARGLLESLPETARWYRVAAAVLPVPFFVLFLWKFISSVRLMDEMERRIQMEALVFAYPLIACLLMVLGLMEMALGGLNPADWSYRHAWAFVPLFYFIGLAFARKRYQ